MAPDVMNEFQRFDAILCLVEFTELFE